MFLVELVQWSQQPHRVERLELVMVVNHFEHKCVKFCVSTLPSEVLKLFLQLQM